MQAAVASVLQMELGSAAHQFFDKCGAGSFRFDDRRLNHGRIDPKAARVEVDQLPATILVRQRKLDGLINAQDATRAPIPGAQGGWL